VGRWGAVGKGSFGHPVFANARTAPKSPVQR
jgi:hypothetical protein